MKKLIYGGLFLALVGIGFIGCNKEDINNIGNNSNIPKFDSFEALYEKMDMLNKMGEKERRGYEIANGYKSLLTEVYEVYEGVDVESLKS